MPLDGPASPRPKSAQLARGERRYRRKVVSAKGWQRIAAEKSGSCRVCTSDGPIALHHLVSREDFGDDVADNIVPLCWLCHDKITSRSYLECRELLEMLTDAEYAYMVERGGEDYAERAYGLRYSRP